MRIETAFIINNHNNPKNQKITMKTTRNNSRNNGSGNASGRVEESKLKELFIDQLKDIYWAEKALTKAIPKLIKKASSPELVEALENHLEETEGQVQKLEEVFELFNEKPIAKKCVAMEGLIKETEEVIKDTDEGAMRDAGIIAAAQKVEHYEIATYGTLRTFANVLGSDDAVELLEEILDQEKGADERLTEVAEATINLEAAAETEEGEEE